MSKRKKNEKEFTHDSFKKSISLLFKNRPTKLNEALHNEYISLLRDGENLYYCGMDFNGMVKVINTISKNPERNNDYIQNVKEGNLLCLNDGSPKDPQMKFICNCNYIRSHIQDEILRKN